MKELQKAQIAALKKFNAEFCADVPEAARGGNYSVRKDDPLAGKRVPVPNGRYRVVGSEWIFGFEGSRLIDAVRAVPPDFGGDNIILVD